MAQASGRSAHMRSELDALSAADLMSEEDTVPWQRGKADPPAVLPEQAHLRWQQVPLCQGRAAANGGDTVRMIVTRATTFTPGGQDPCQPDTCLVLQSRQCAHVRRRENSHHGLHSGPRSEQTRGQEAVAHLERAATLRRCYARSAQRHQIQSSSPSSSPHSRTQQPALRTRDCSRAFSRANFICKQVPHERA